MVGLSIITGRLKLLLKNLANWVPQSLLKPYGLIGFSIDDSLKEELFIPYSSTVPIETIDSIDDTHKDLKFNLMKEVITHIKSQNVAIFSHVDKINKVLKSNPIYETISRLRK